MSQNNTCETRKAIRYRVKISNLEGMTMEKQVWMLRKINFLHPITNSFIDISAEEKKNGFWNALLGSSVLQSWSIEQAS